MPVYKTKNKTKDGRQWYFTYSYKINGDYKKYKSKKYLTKGEAQQGEANFIISENITDYSTNKTIKELATEYYQYQASRVKPTTLRSIKRKLTYIVDKLGDKRLKSLKIKELEKFKNEMPFKWSVSHKNGFLKYLKALNNFSNKVYDYKNNQFDKLDNFKDNEIKKEMLYFTIDEFKKFIDKVEEINYKALFTTLFYCGLRQGEALALTWEDIGNFINVTKTLTSKVKGEPFTIMTPKNTSSIRKVPIPDPVKKVLNKWYNIISKTHGFTKEWFVFRDFKPLKETSITNIKNKACKEAGVKQIRIHDFRHSCASLLINNGAKINLVAEYLGHSDIKMTLNTYSHLYDSELNKVVEKLNNL